MKMRIVKEVLKMVCEETVLKLLEREVGVKWAVI